MPMDRSEREEPMTGSDRSEWDDLESDIPLNCHPWMLPVLCRLSWTRNNTGSELECTKRICPVEDEVCEDWDVFLTSVRSRLHKGQEVALRNHGSTHFAWKTC
mmetsp:Transcript_59707/g.177655  ORF Transcript_59707/g.177655 Transcript_59707/m.177655 type:complete len:103 (+) Transcript_59707:1131-1439(+)